MSESLLFGNSIVDIPTSADSPNWATGVTQAFEAIAETLATVAGPFDVPSQSLNIDAFNPGVPNTDIVALSFPITSVRAINIAYAIYRSTNSTTAYETGNLIAIYSAGNPVNSKWEISQDFVGDGGITFNITDLGQVQFTASTLAGTGYSGSITFSAKAILQP